jgi:hypothetical protein
VRGFKFVTTVAAFSVAAFSVALGTGVSQASPSFSSTEPPPSMSGQQATDAYSKLPVAFVENRGQADPAVRYYAQGDRYAFYLTQTAIVLSLAKRGAAAAGAQANDAVSLALRFVGADPKVEPQGATRAAGVVNDLRGSNPARWHTQIPQFLDVVYPDLWPKIDLRLREQSGVLKYEFHVRPGASTSDIALAYGGARGLGLAADGGLQISTPQGMLADSAPVSYQTIDGVRTPVDSRYVLDSRAPDKAGFSFAVGRYRTDHELVIDPGVQYTTFLGGNAAETGEGIAVDSAGNAFVAGTTQSPDFPTTAGAFKRTGSAQNSSDVFVSKLNAAGTALIYSTFVGGSDLETGHALAVDSAGNAYVTGTTKSSNFPTTGGAFDRSLNIPPNCPRCATDNTDGFAFKLNAAGSALTYSTYLGGTDIDSPRDIAVDGSGSAYVTGETLSTDFPTTTGAFSRTLHGDYDMFVTKLNPTGSALTYSTFLGGALVDNGQRISVDSGGNAYALGFSSSADFPTTAGAFDRTANGGFDVTLTKLNPAGSALVYSTYIGGSDFDSGGGLAIDSTGSAFVAGSTPSANWPTTPGAYDTTFNNGDAYVTKLNPAGSALAFSTFVGGSAGDSFSGIVVDPAGNSWLSGTTGSTDYPVTAGAPDTTFNGGVTDATITELNAAGSSLLFGSFLGGSQSESGYDIARDSTGNIYLTGLTYSQDFPATVGAFDRVFNGDLSIFWGDAFVTKVDITATSSTPTAPPGVPAAPTLVSPSNASSQPQPITFDWNDVPEAVSYTIQIDDSSGFTAPLVREQSVTSSVYATSDLATTTHFWRVRGVNSAGVVGAWSAVRSFTPQTAPPAATLSTLDVNPSSVAGGTSAAGTVVMSVAATNGAVVSLSSSNPAVASVPATTTVAPSGFTGTFTVTTSAVASSTPVTITASYNGTTRTAPLTVTPASTGASLQSVAVSPSSVSGGSNASGVVSLSGGAPAGGAILTLSSSNPAVVSVPTSVTIADGTSTRGFTVTTSSVATATTATITATYHGASSTAGVTVTPAAPPPPQNATLTLTATGRSGETVVSAPSGVSVRTGSSGTASFATGTSVTLQASSGRSVVWSGACSSGGSKTKGCTFTINATAAVTANVQ